MVECHVEWGSGMSPKLPQLICMAILVAAFPALGQEKSPVPRDLPVDRVPVDGGELRGLVYGVNARGDIWFACRKVWLRKAHPELSTRLEKEQEEREWDLRTDYMRRLALWDKSLEPTAENRSLKDFIDLELSRMDPGLGPEGPAARGPFILVKLDTVQGRKLVRARPEYLRLALTGWKEEVEKLEEQSAATTIAELKKDGLQWDKENPDFSARMPGMPVESDGDWELRKAFLSFARGKQLRFQGTGETIFEVPEGAGPGAAAGPGLNQILGKLGPGILNGALGELLGENAPGRQDGQKAAAEAAAIADRKNIRQFRLTRVQPDLVRHRVTVDDSLHAKLPSPNGLEWKRIHHGEIEADATLARPQLEARIQQDPRAGPMLAQLRQVGLGDKLDEAIRFGAATQEAQQQADAAFQNALKRYTVRVDGPPIRWLATPERKSP